MIAFLYKITKSVYTRYRQPQEKVMIVNDFY